MNRKLGYYWIRHFGNWVVAEYDRIGNTYWWLIPGDDIFISPSQEGKTIIVNENRIIPPDQEAAKNG